MKCAMAIGAALVVAVPIMSLSASPSQAPGANGRVAIDLSSTRDGDGTEPSAAQRGHVRAATAEGIKLLAGLSG